MELKVITWKTVFFLNGAETPVLNLTRGLDYEFNINGTDISKNKFVFTKELKSDGVDICLNPLDTTKVITSGLTYEINNSSVNFQEFNKIYEIEYENFYYIDLRPLLQLTTTDDSLVKTPLEIDSANIEDWPSAKRWAVSNITLFDITTNTYTYLYHPTDSSGANHVTTEISDRQAESLMEAAIGRDIDDNLGQDPNPGRGNANLVNFWYDGNQQGPAFIRYGAFINPNHEYRFGVNGRASADPRNQSYTNVDILDKDFNKVLTVNPNSGFNVYNSLSSNTISVGDTGIFKINPTNHVYPSDNVERAGDIVTQRKIKWSIPFNEINVPTNSFYSSDISDNLGSNIVFNTNPIYGAMKFIDGDSIQFHLDYSQKSIVDASGVALDSSGNKLGSNSVEDQDYIVRLKIHDLFHQPKLIAGSYDNSDNLITDTNSLTSYYNFSTNYQFSAGTNEDTRNWQNWVTLDGSGIYLNNEASGNILGLQFATDSDEFGIGISTDICNNIWEEKPWEINETPTDVSMISSNKFIWAFDASLNGNDYKYKIADTGGVIEDYPVDKLHNQKYNWKIEIKSDGKLCLKTSTDSALNVISSYSNIILYPDTRYYLWIGSKDASFNFTNLKYLPERKVFDDKVTLAPLTPTYTPGSTIPYNSYNVSNQSDSTTYITVADEILLVTVANSTFYINGNIYSDANPLELDKNKTYRFNLVNATNVDTLLGFSEDSGNATPYNNVTYNGTPGVYSVSSTVPKHLRTPYVDIISGADPSILYYYDVSGVATNTAGKINFT